MLCGRNLMSLNCGLSRTVTTSYGCERQQWRTLFRPPMAGSRRRRGLPAAAHYWTPRCGALWVTIPPVPRRCTAASTRLSPTNSPHSLASDQLLPSSRSFNKATVEKHIGPVHDTDLSTGTCGRHVSAHIVKMTYCSVWLDYCKALCFTLWHPLLPYGYSCKSSYG